MVATFIASWDELREQIAAILERLDAEPALAMAAAANPLLALEELGYVIDPAARQAIADRLRFPLRIVAKLEALREAIYAAAGRPFDLDDPDQLRQVLYDELRIRPLGGAPLPAIRPLTPPTSWLTPRADPLAALAGAHPIITPLLAYRALEVRAPRLAPRPLYDEIRAGRRRLRLDSIISRLRERAQDR